MIDCFLLIVTTKMGRVLKRRVDFYRDLNDVKNSAKVIVVAKLFAYEVESKRILKRWILWLTWWNELFMVHKWTGTSHFSRFQHAPGAIFRMEREWAA